jgi:hypothetical protein
MVIIIIIYTEFLIAAINEEKLLSVLKMEQAFKIIDLVIIYKIYYRTGITSFQSKSSKLSWGISKTISGSKSSWNVTVMMMARYLHTFTLLLDLSRRVHRLAQI